MKHSTDHMLGSVESTNKVSSEAVKELDEATKEQIFDSAKSFSRIKENKELLDRDTLINRLREELSNMLEESRYFLEKKDYKAFMLSEKETEKLFPEYESLILGKATPDKVLSNIQKLEETWAIRKRER